ncbi:MAG: hypothetical protein ABL986_14065 [Vicinamibacterales bacterium]
MKWLMTMLDLQPEQRSFLAEALRDIANVAAGAMAFGQVLSERPFSIVVATSGVVLWIALIAYSARLIRRGIHDPQ